MGLKLDILLDFTVTWANKFSSHHDLFLFLWLFKVRICHFKESWLNEESAPALHSHSSSSSLAHQGLHTWVLTDEEELTRLKKGEGFPTTVQWEWAKNWTEFAVFLDLLYSLGALAGGEWVLLLTRAVNSVCILFHFLPLSLQLGSLASTPCPAV